MNPSALHRLPVPTTRRTWIAASLVVFALLAAAGTSAAWLLDDDTHLRAVIAEPLDPGPGIRIIELPGGRERVLLRNSGFVVDQLDWAPTGNHLWAVAHSEEDLNSRNLRFLLVSYPDGGYAEIEFAEGDLGSWPAWSPDGTRVAFISDLGFYLFGSDGELLAQYSESELGFDLTALSEPGTGFWSSDSQLVLVKPWEPTTIIDRTGDVVGKLLAEGPPGTRLQHFVRWWPRQLGTC